METIIIDTRDIRPIEGAVYHSDDRGGGVRTAWSRDGEPIARFTFGNGNTSSEMYGRVAGTEVYRDGYGYFGRKSDLVPAFEHMGATYMRRA